MTPSLINFGVCMFDLLILMKAGLWFEKNGSTPFAQGVGTFMIIAAIIVPMVIQKILWGSY